MYRLKNVKPDPIKDGLLSASNVWATDCVLEKGKQYLVTAPSGKGKSTLVHILYGLRKDYSGEALLDDKNISDFSLEDWATIRQERTSIVFQDLRLFLDFSGYDNIRLKADLQMPKTRAEIEEMAARLGVKQFLDQRCGTLSYGQRQRMAIVRAMCQPFDFLFLDEPFSHLDVENIKAATALIEETCAAQGAGLLVVSLGDPYFFKYDGHLIL